MRTATATWSRVTQSAIGGVERFDHGDDTTGSTHPDAVETWYDGIDSDCAGDDDFDADGDVNDVPLA